MLNYCCQNFRRNTKTHGIEWDFSKRLSEFYGNFWEITDDICDGCCQKIYYMPNIMSYYKFAAFLDGKINNYVNSFVLRATAWEKWLILGKSNSHYFLQSWYLHQIFFSLYKKCKLNIFGPQNWAPPFLQIQNRRFCNFLENTPFFVILKSTK
jgi:hypothetical protein